MTRVKIEDRDTVRSAVVGIAVTSTEKELIRQRAFAANVSVSQYLRNKVFGTELKGKLFKSDPKGDLYA